MLHTSLRRVARSRPHTHSISTRPHTPSVIAANFTTKGHQRRQSSSKPPVPPNDGSRAIPAASVKTVGTPRAKESAEKRPGAESRLAKRKVGKDKTDTTQDAQNEWTKSLPSVASTQYLNPKDVYIASFFSTHRPMSITSSLPSEVPVEEFEKIFSPKPKTRQRPAPADVIYTISSAVDSLEDSSSENQQSSQHDTGVSQRADIIQALIQHNNITKSNDPNQPQHLDGQPNITQMRVPNGVKLVIQEIARRFRPFNVPPVPTPVSDSELSAREAESASEEASEERQAQELEAQIESQDGEQLVLTLQQSADVREGHFFTSHNSPTVMHIQTEDGIEHHELVQEIHAPQEQQQQQHQSTQRRRRTGIISDQRLQRKNELWYAISVKRQRRLKMKKHKYKKLMRKTRNLRRRQDKL